MPPEIRSPDPRPGGGLRMILLLLLPAACLLLPLVGCAPESGFDLIVRGGTVYDGSGGAPVRADVGVRGDSIVAVGDLSGARAGKEIDASGMAVSPGFVNMLSWATETLLEDGRAMSDVHQGVTLEVLGEGTSMGPIPDSLKEWARSQQGDIEYEITWNSLGDYLEHLEEKGVSVNVASFVGATTVRINVVGFDDRPPTEAELERMVAAVHDAMEEGAVGVSSALIYTPAFYADTPELTALARAAGEHDGMYISHMRSEGNRLLESLDELLTVAREAGVRSEIYHLKAAGASNYGKLDELIRRVEAARDEGVGVTADMYTYTAGATGLDAAMPPWSQEGGPEAWFDRLRDPAMRTRIAAEMVTPTDEWENLMLAAGGPDNVLLVGFKQDSLKHLTGKTLAEVAQIRGTSPEITAMDLVAADESRVDAVYFMMSEENVKKKVALPWMSFCSDAGAPASEGVFLRSNPHPRAYGSFARLLGKYVREEGVIPLEEAVRRLTSFPAENLKLRRRGRLEPGYFADVVVFDPATISDEATFAEPHPYATGVEWVMVNGEVVLREGEHTGATPGRVVRGPGWVGWEG